MSEFEQELTSLWTECFQRKPKGFRGTTALSYLVNRAASAVHADYVFYDAGPNIGPLNRVILLDCDYFIVPAACDLFSIRALKTLGYTLSKWVRDWQTVIELAPDNLYLLPGRPGFLGYIPQRFRVYGGQPARDYASYLPRIERQILSDVVSVLRETDSSLASEAVQLGQIKDFSSLAASSQREGQPFMYVKAATGEQRADARESFAGVARKILERTTRR